MRPPAPRAQAAFESAGPLDAWLSVLDLDGLVVALEQSDRPFLEPPRSAGYGREFYLRDPDGHVLGFVASAAG